MFSHEGHDCQYERDRMMRDRLGHPSSDEDDDRSPLMANKLNVTVVCPH